MMTKILPVRTESVCLKVIYPPEGQAAIKEKRRQRVVKKRISK